MTSRTVKSKSPSRVVGVRMSDKDYWLLKALAVERRTKLATLILQGVELLVKQKAQAA